MQINLLPWREQRKKRLQKRFVVMLIISAMIGLFPLMALHLIVKSQITHQTNRNDYLQTVLNQESAAVFKLNQEKKEMLKINDELNKLISLRRKSYGIVQLLDSLPRLMPNAMMLNSMTYADQQLMLSGKSSSDLEITLLIKNMENSALFDQPSLANIQAEETSTGEIRVFQIRANAKD